MVKISVDCRFASSPTGLGRYTRSMMAALLRRDDATTYVLLVRSPDEGWIAALPSPERRAIVTADIPHYTLAEHTTLRAIIRRIKPDLHFSMHFTSPFFCPVPSAITVHDLILHRFANGASAGKQLAYRILLRRALSCASAVFTPTNAVADDLAREYGEWIRFRTIITGEGIDDAYTMQPPDRIAAARARYGIDESFFLYVGNAKEHKNVRMLLDAHARLGAGATQLVLISYGPEANALSLPSNTLLLQNVSDEDLPALFSGAACCVTASLDEGFCLPVVEALACGCPVIASDIPVIREVTKGQATLVAPSVDAFAMALASPPPRPSPQRLWSWDAAAKSVTHGLHDAVRFVR